MAKTIRLRVLTAQGLAIDTDTTAIRAPGELGSLGMLYNHAPLVTTLSPGTLTWRTPEGGRLRASLGFGILEVVKNQVTILTDRVSEPSAAPTGREL